MDYTIVIKIILAYLIGALNFAYILSKILRFDILTSKDVFDENFGAYNVYRATKNIYLAILVAILDISKAILVAELFGIYYTIATLLGHNFSLITYVFTKKIFTGMGLSVLFGAMLMYDPRTIIIYFIVYSIHKIAFKRFLDKKEWLAGHHLYSSIYIALAGLIYYSIFDREDIWYFTAMYIIVVVSSMIRWKITIRKILS